MSYIRPSASARADLQRLYDFLAEYDVSIADNGITAILAGFRSIELSPTAGAPVPERPFLRKFVVDFGASGYLIFHKRYEKTDTNLVLRILHQKEWYDTETIGLAEEDAGRA